MHEKTGRFLCRICFVLLCAAPTSGVIAWGAYLQTPLYHSMLKAKWETRWSQQSGLLVSIEQVSRSQKIILLSQVAFADPETGAELAKVRVIEIAQTDRDWVLLAQQPEIRIDRAQRLWSALDQQFMQRRIPGNWSLQCNVQEATLLSEDAAKWRTLTDIHCRLDNTKAGPQINFEFRLAGHGMTKPAVIRLTRNRQIRPPQTAFEIDTGGQALPCSLFAPSSSVLARLGEESRFRGTIWATSSQAGLKGEASGVLSEIDLDRLVTDQFPHKLSGKAKIQLRRAAFQESRLTECAGDLQSADGVVSASLLAAAAESLKLKLHPTVKSNPAKLWNYQRLAFGFSLDEGGAALSGLCDKRGAIFIDRSGAALLSDAPGAELPASAVVRMLAPESRLMVPASRETNLLLQALPSPSALSPTKYNARRRYDSLRLEEESLKRK